MGLRKSKSEFCFLRVWKHYNSNGTSFRAVVAASNYQTKTLCYRNRSKASVDLNNLDFYRSENIKLTSIEVGGLFSAR